MKAGITVLFVAAIICTSLLGTSVLAGDRDDAIEHQCAARFGTTGSELPALIQEAIRVFPRDKFELRTDQVVYITDFNGFVDCLGIQSESVRNFLFRQELIVLHNAFPIYINTNEDPVAAFRNDGRFSYLKYFFASFIGNGWIHATGEKNDYPAYSFELSLLESYRKRLPASDLVNDHFEEVRGLMEEARLAEQYPRNVVSVSSSSARPVRSIGQMRK